MRLAPLGFVALVAIHVLSPGAFGSILFQLQPARLGVATVSDRAADYDAVRPDVWSHLAFGRGYGSYDHLSYRILDSDMLSRLVDMGVLGRPGAHLHAVLDRGRRATTDHSRHPDWSPPALAVAAAAMAFFVFTFLFDVTSFPHVPYILLALAGLLAVVVRGADEEPPRRPSSARARRPYPAGRCAAARGAAAGRPRSPWPAEAGAEVRRPPGR